MRNPGLTAILCALGVIGGGWSIFLPGPEAPSPMLAILQWVLFLGCIVGVIASLIQLGSKPR